MNSTLHGGNRVGSGRKKKSNLEKMQSGNPGGRKLKVIDTGEELESFDMPPVKDYLLDKQRDGNDFMAHEIYSEVFAWLCRVKCQHIVSQHLIEHFAVSQARYIQCEQAISKYGLIAKHPTTGGPIQSPYVNMANTFMKQITLAWTQIYQIVKENSTVDYRGPNPQDDMMERLLSEQEERMRQKSFIGMMTKSY